RRRSRSKKRSSSTPPRIYEPLVTDKSKNQPPSGSEDRLKWVVKAGNKVSYPNPPLSDSLPVKSAHMVSSLNIEKSQVEETESIIPTFPRPPDWDTMSGKAKKKELKIWHNKIRSTVPGASDFRVVRSWIASNNLLVGGFLETHVMEDNAPSVLASTLPGWRMDSNYCCFELGRIWIVWDPSVSVLVFKRTDQLVICIGDFNQIAASNEHYSIIPSAFSLRGIDDFQNCLRDNDLVDLPSRSTFYIWSNHHQDNPIIRKLDRALANDAWLVDFPSSLAVFDPPGDSDHAPCIIQIENQPARSKKCFKYFSFLSSHPTFLACIASAWEEQVAVGSCMFSLGENLKVAKGCCRRLNRQGFGNIQQKTADALSRLQELQVELLFNPSHSLFREEHVARKKWDFFAAALETFYRQKSRIRWLEKGDANTRFFHRAVLANHAKNLIRYLRGDDDARVENVDQIEGMIVTYYSHLLGSESDAVSPYSVERIKGLHPFRCDSTLAEKLSVIPTEEEIISCIFSMPKNKAPGPDGFPVEFFWEAWPVVKDCTVAAVKEIFQSGHLLRKFNATAITLIPKETGADRLSQFRPVACCNTIYKVIT
ncbi:unnamed protein product, partial [Arabidopsis halleri]